MPQREVRSTSKSDFNHRRCVVERESGSDGEHMNSLPTWNTQNVFQYDRDILVVIDPRERRARGRSSSRFEKVFLSAACVRSHRRFCGAYDAVDFPDGRK